MVKVVGVLVVVVLVVMVVVVAVVAVKVAAAATVQEFLCVIMFPFEQFLIKVSLILLIVSG